MKPGVYLSLDCLISAILFAEGEYAWLRNHWRHGNCRLLVGRDHLATLVRMLYSPVLELSRRDRYDLLGELLPFVELVTANTLPNLVDFVVTSSTQVLNAPIRFAVVETPQAYRSRCGLD